MKKPFFNRFQNYMTRLANVKTRRILLQLDDRVLQDAGISRELLLSGVSAWPWRIEETVNTPLQLVTQNVLSDDASTAGPDSGFQRAA